MQTRINFIAKFVHTNGEQRLVSLPSRFQGSIYSPKRGNKTCDASVSHQGGNSRRGGICFSQRRASHASPSSTRRCCSGQKPPPYREQVRRLNLERAVSVRRGDLSLTVNSSINIFFLVEQIKGPWHSCNSYRRTKAPVLPCRKPRL